MAMPAAKAPTIGDNPIAVAATALPKHVAVATTSTVPLALHRSECVTSRGAIVNTTPIKSSQNAKVRNRLDKSSENDIHLRRDIFDMTFLPLCGDAWKPIAETLYVFGQGMKVAIEIAVAAVEIGKIGSSTKVISVGGTGEGADTAVVLRTSTQKESFVGKPEKRLSIQEILAMPIEKW